MQKSNNILSERKSHRLEAFLGKVIALISHRSCEVETFRLYILIISIRSIRVSKVLEVSRFQRKPDVIRKESLFLKNKRVCIFYTTEVEMI